MNKNHGTNQELIRLTAVAKLSQKAQITVPAEVRKVLGIREGDSVIFEVTGETVEMKPLKLHTFQSVLGMLSTGGPSSDLEELRQTAKRRKATQRGTGGWTGGNDNES